VDPYAVLGVRPGSTEQQVAAAYKQLAKRWHPDRGDGAERAARMAEINAAYEAVRGGAEPTGPAADGTPPPLRADVALRSALAPELSRMIARDEQLRIVTPASTWASPRTVLVLTDRRLLWLLDDAVANRVRSLLLRDLAAVSRRPRRRGATLTLRTHAGQRHTFHELRPATAEAIERQVRPA